VNLGFEIGLLSLAAIVLADAVIETTHMVSRRRRSGVYAINRHLGDIK